MSLNRCIFRFILQAFLFYGFVSSNVPRSFPFTMVYPEVWMRPICAASTPYIKFQVGDAPNPHGRYGDEFDFKKPWSYFQRRIFYGQNAHDGKAETFPFMNICAVVPEGPNKYIWCTCTILNEIWVISSKRCFKNRDPKEPPESKVKGIQITYGSFKLLRHPQNREVIEMHFHPDRTNDACLLKVDHPMMLSKNMTGFYPYSWLKTTGHRNSITKCSTFTCGYVSI